MVVSAPMNEEELRNLMYTAQLENKGPFVIRYPRGNGVLTDWKTPMKEIPVGRGRKMSDGDDVAILTIGHVGNIAAKSVALLAEKGISAAHYDMRFAKPIDELLLHEIFSKFSKVITVEDGCILGGMGSAVVEFMAENGYSSQVKRLGIPDKFIEHGEQSELYIECGFGIEGIAHTAIELLASKVDILVG
jgi:1-deoxy-D-xylulose-5-phosphate synthase